MQNIEIKERVDNGDYFTINRARQYGKTTTIQALANYLKEDYIVLSLDFQMIGNAKFESEYTFSLAFVNYLRRAVNNKKEPILGIEKSMIDQMVDLARSDSSFAFDDMFSMLSDLCDTAEKPVVLMMYDAALANRYRFIEGRHLNMKLVLEGFVNAFGQVAHGKDEKFLEEQGRKFFMLYLKPIINGSGHCYVEAQTRDLRRTDLIVDYLSEQFVIELKIWNRPKYHSDGEKQIAEYLDYYNLKKGYMITFNFNKNKETGVR